LFGRPRQWRGRVYRSMPAPHSRAP
jgi:hypothetical protein